MAPKPNCLKSYELCPSKIFLEQLDGLSVKTKGILKEKLLLIKEHPTRNKRIHYKNLFLFRIRLTDDKKDLRVIYLLENNLIKLICILKRNNDYLDLKKYLI